jgi:phage gpG-like protein
MSDISKGSNLIELDGRFRNPDTFLKRVGAMMKGRIQSTFKDQGRDGVKWRERAVPNVIGIIRDMEAGRKSIPVRRFEARPAGIDTRLLNRSIAYEVRGENTVTIGSTVNYASDVQEGGTHTVRVSSIARNNLRTLVERARAKLKKGTGAGKEWLIAQLGWLLFASQVKVNVPARPFVFFSDKDQGDIATMARDYFGKPGTGAAVQAKP